MKEEIVKLINLQEIDSEIAGFNAHIEKKQKTIADREQSIADKEKAIAACQQKSENLLQLQRDTTAENEDAATRIKERQNKMMLVQTSREHQALLKEIEDNKKLLKETEEKSLLILEQLEQKKSEQAELENLCAGEREMLKDEIEQVEKEVKKIDSNRKKVENKREELAGELKAQLLKRYTMLLKKRDGLAVVPTVEAVCQGCFMTIPPQQFNEVRKGEALNLCPNCQRILYFQEREEETVEQ